MQPLNVEEQAIFTRYRKCSTAVDRFILLQASALASNKLLAAIEASFVGQELKSSDYLFLQVLSEKRRKNFQKLRDVKETQQIFTKLRDSALTAARLGNS